MLENATKFPSGEYSLLTVVVNASHAVFYRNTATEGIVAMPRYACDIMRVFACDILRAFTREIMRVFACDVIRPFLLSCLDTDARTHARTQAYM